MIDKKRIGQYLKQLRLKKTRDKDSKSFSQDDLASQFIHRGIDLSTNSIAEWECGASLPSIENLKILAEIYGRTIDEILDGEDRKDIEYSDIYFLGNQSKEKAYDLTISLYQQRNEQKKQITSRFKELLLIRTDRFFTANEEDEFRFLLDRYYHESDYLNLYTSLPDDIPYIRIQDGINVLLCEIKDKTKEEKYWELQKLFAENKEIWFDFNNDVFNLIDTPIIQERYEDIDDWQKDMLLAMFQTIDPCDINPSNVGSWYYKWYEKQYGEYDHDQIIKNEMKELIQRGACINKLFFTFKRKYYETHRIIDRLEELYDLCLKPIEIKFYSTEDKNFRYKIENNAKNRFLKKYYFTIKSCLKADANMNDYSDIDEIYEWFNSHDKVPEEYYLLECKKHNVNKNQEKKYWMADIKNICGEFEKNLTEFKNIEKTIASGLIEIEKLKERLQSGEREYKIPKLEIIGGTDEASIRNHIEKKKSSIDLSEFVKNRNIKTTKQLLKDLDKLSLKEIREKYFEMEVIEDE